MHHLSIGLDIYMNKNDNILFLGDFNSEKSENYLNHLRDVYKLQNIVKEATCFKNPDNPSYIDGKLSIQSFYKKKNSIQNKIQKFEKKNTKIYSIQKVRQFQQQFLWRETKQQIIKY